MDFLAYGTDRVSNACRLGKYYQSVFESLSPAALHEILDALVEPVFTETRIEFKNRDPADGVPILMKRFRQFSPAKFSRVLSRVKILKELEVDALEKILDIREEEVEYERGKRENDVLRLPQMS